MTQTDADHERMLRLNLHVKKGHEAEQVIKDPAIRSAFDDVHSKMLEDMAQVDLTDTARHTTLIIAFQQLALVRGALERAIRDGKSAQAKLAEGEMRRPRPYHPPK